MPALVAVIPNQLLNIAAVIGSAGAVAVVGKMVSTNEVYITSIEQARLGLHNSEVAHKIPHRPF